MPGRPPIPTPITRANRPPPSGICSSPDPNVGAPPSAETKHEKGRCNCHDCNNGALGALLDNHLLSPAMPGGIIAMPASRKSKENTLFTHPPQFHRTPTLVDSDAYNDIIRTTQYATGQDAQIVMINSFAEIAIYRDTDTGDHLRRIQAGVTGIATVLRDTGWFIGQVNDAFITTIGVASLLHDIGKVGIPDAILNKTGVFDFAERQVMETHTVIGSDMLMAVAGRLTFKDYIITAAEIARHHHEHFDGNGYPDRLSGQAIPLPARIVAVIDVFDALTSPRVYKHAWTKDDAISFICDRSSHQFDPMVVDAFLLWLDK